MLLSIGKQNAGHVMSITAEKFILERDLTDPVFPTGKKKDSPISGSAVIKTCAAGDHAMYKFPMETKEFYMNVTKECRSGDQVCQVGVLMLLFVDMEKNRINKYIHLISYHFI